MLADALNRLRTHPQPDQMRDVLLDIANAFMDRDEAEIEASEQKLFGDFIAAALDRLGEDIRAMLADAVSDSGIVPSEVAEKAARDGSLKVAASFLTHSPSLTDTQLVSLAETEAEDRQIAIARRDHVSRDVSDALIAHGTDTVLVALSDNMRADYSQIGLARLLHRVGDNPLVQVSLARRGKEQSGFDQVIYNSVDDTLRAKLGGLFEMLDASAYRVIARSAAEGVARAAGQELSERFGRHALMRQVKSGDISFDQAFGELCASARLNDCVLALAERLNMPANLVRLNFARPESDRLAILCRAADVSSDHYAALSRLRLTAIGAPDEALAGLLAEYSALDPAQARRAVRIVRLRVADAEGAEPQSTAATG